MRHLMISTAMFLGASVALAGAPLSPGHVVSVSGDQAWIQHGKDRTTMKTGDEFHSGDILVTGAASSAKLLLGPGEVAMLLKPESTVVVDKTEQRFYVVTVKSGALLSTVREPGKATTHFFIRTQSATMGVRGTTLYVREEKGKPTFFCPCHGKIAVTAQPGQGEVVFESKHHDTPKLISTGNQKLSDRMVAVPAGMDVGHNDAEIDDLKTLLKQE